MKKLWDWLMNALPLAWGFLWALIITFGSIAVLITIVSWLLTLVGVI